MQVMQVLSKAWVKRLYDFKHDWSTLIQKELSPVSEFLMYRTSAVKKVNVKLKNPFWKEVISVWSEL